MIKFTAMKERAYIPQTIDFRSIIDINVTEWRVIVIIGKVIKYGDNIDTDVIIPARYLNTSDPNELAKHCMEDLDGDFLNKISKGDILVAGRNFGCGSSREHAPVVIKTSGISLIIAKSFARIFYRNAINIGLPILECPKAADAAENGDILKVDLAGGKIYDETKGLSYDAEPFPEFIREIMSYDGLINYVKAQVTKNV